MVEVDPAAIRARILALPWVAEVSVARSWPSTVVVNITERSPVAQLAAGAGGPAVVDGTGRVLVVGAAASQLLREWQPPLPQLQGVAAAGAPGRVLSGAQGVLALLGALAPPLDLPGTGGHSALTRWRLVAVDQTAGATLQATLTAVPTSGPGASPAAGAGASPGGGVRASPGGGSGGPSEPGEPQSGVGSASGTGQVVTVIFGSAAQLGTKVAAWRSVAAQLAPGVSATIDVQVADAPVLTYTEKRSIVSTTQRG
jgi:hypothetical protein